MHRVYVPYMGSAVIAKTAQALTVLTMNQALHLTAKRCKSCRTSALSLHLSMVQKEDTAVQKNRLTH